MQTHFAADTQYTLNNEPALVAFATDFALRLRVGDTVALDGPIGAGKTSFVRAVVRALHGSERTTSPTFTFWQHYAGNPPVEHLDFYRIERTDAIAELGLEAAFSEASIILVEWWRNAPALLPHRRYEIDLAGAGDAPRTLRLRCPA